ncbi:aspartate kinase [Gemmatirosa kalamazoonensis]|uniref:Aspartokinase n=1 Tax=Gemmatirosa kalamazoonensis TaxID=861299 RepID=W0RND5_9BACT|nr:lysine-sensitive aspartokinase 3 [Gemmatirosa kalamazoonensis]AHG90963.1 aspartate kinase [Gemmatirosa kalamazoonensis]
MIVVKFGGTSVGDAEAIERAASIVRGRLPGRPVIVVSAMGGATNALLALAEQASRGQLIGAARAVEALRERHLNAVTALVPDAQAATELSGELGAMFDELARLAEAISVLGFLTPRSLDTIAAYGEILSSHLVTAAFRARDIPAELVDARRVMITDDHFCKAEPDADRIAEAARAHLQPHLREGRVPIMGGFIGATPDGITTTLGRGGSDYSASLVGAALQADVIEIWTDVDGMLTADPRVVPDARLIERIRFDEASELASFGAKVLHPSTIAPAVRRGIPVYIYNSRRPEGKGTLITSDAPRRPVSAIAAKSATTVVKLRSTRMLLASGFMKTVFEIFERHRTSVDVIATSEVSLSVTLDDPSNLDELLGDLTPLGDVSVERERGIVSIVGAGLSDNGVALARAFGALGDLRVHMASLSATGINLTLVVDGEHVGPAMQRLHDAFFGEGAT